MGSVLAGTSISGEVLIFWDFGQPAESFAAEVRLPSGKAFLFVAEPEARLVDPTFDEELFRAAVRRFLAESSCSELWVEYDPGRDSAEGEELITCPSCGQSFVIKKSMYLPKALDFAELSYDGQFAFLQEHFGHEC
ncbi:hypothetical protein Desaci_4739 (plasmid) [Desulfosporosinus acidiphilus SJ4]|uniref:Uncharacterized protein n=1 Tax=Desulfosporosinus acidiphilus (strain DSM 22704 / JCM 16185 / SJ4) TaxID=646529 RepID=I4DCP1_DESAJ|nr:hypothetical protein [Desulfosporosinus acidiphilus]AFM43565.1 hypothetical protein Desaci_4739 [Desulfosporosinus acidiphilus SJ4]